MMLDPRLKSPDHVTLVAPLGVTFHDEVSGAIISDGLEVTLTPALDRPANSTAARPVSPRQMSAFPNPSGVFVAHNVSGLRRIETGEGDADFWNNLPEARRAFRITVKDRDRRFYPFSFIEYLPVWGILSWSAELVSPPAPPSPPQTPPLPVPLFSTPERTVPGGMGVLRATLQDRVTGLPAAWAILNVQVTARLTVRAVADSQGRVTVVFPYPEPKDPSPVVGGGPVPEPQGTGIWDQIWTVRLEARYSRPAEPADPPPEIPSLRAILRQPVTDLWADNSALSASLAPQKLGYGRELVVRSKDATNGRDLSVLLVG